MHSVGRAWGPPHKVEWEMWEKTEEVPQTRKWSALGWALTIVFATGMLVNGVAAGEKPVKPQKPAKKEKPTWDIDNLPLTIFDKSIGDWVVDRFAGNNTAGTWFYQGPAREVGALQSPTRHACVEGGDGTVYLAIAIQGAVVPRLMKVTPDGVLWMLMEDRGLIEGPMEACRAGFPVWNPKEKALYLTGPNCLRKVVEKPDGSLWVEVVAGVPNKAGSQDGPMKEATFPDVDRGVVCNSKGTFYRLQDHTLRRIENGMVSSIRLKRSDGSKYIFVLIYDYQGLSLGENDDTLYIDDFYNPHVGGGVLKCDVKTGELTRICGLDRRKDKYKRYGREADGPALTHTSGNAGTGLTGLYHPFYNAMWVGGPDHFRFRWLRLDGDGWVRTVFAARRPGTKPPRLRLMDLLHARGVPGEYFRFGRAGTCIDCRGIDSKGGVYIGMSTLDTSGLWRAYNKNWPAQGKKEVQP